MKIDLRPRCAREKCKKLITRGKQRQEEYKKYHPYCSYHCQEWARIEDAHEYINALKQGQ